MDTSPGRVAVARSVAHAEHLDPAGLPSPAQRAGHRVGDDEHDPAALVGADGDVGGGERGDVEVGRGGARHRCLLSRTGQVARRGSAVRIGR